MREVDQVGTQEIWVLFPTLPQASCVTVASHTAFQHSPEQKGEKRASMISNSKPMVPEHWSSKELAPSCWMRASVTPTRCCLHVAMCNPGHSLTRARCHSIPTSFQLENSTAVFLQWFNVCFLMLHRTQPVGAQGSQGQAATEGASPWTQREVCVAAKAKGQMLYLKSL